MSTQFLSVRSRSSRLLALITAFLVAVGGLLVMPVVAHAAPTGVTNGTLDWGVKESWRTYIDGPGNPGGSTVMIAPASTTPAAYHWYTNGTGTFDDATQTGSFSAVGGVTWNHPTHGIQTTLQNLTVNFNLTAGTGTIVGDYSDPEQEKSATGSHLVDFTFASTTASGGTVTVSNAAAVAVQGFNDIFGAYYPVGTVLDPVSFSFNYALPATATATTLAADETAIELGETVELTATVAPAAAGTVEFFNGTTSLGAAVAVSAGVATLPSVSLPAGTNNLTAVFTSTDAAYLGSTSDPLVVTVTVPASAVATTTTVGAPAPAAPVLLGASVDLTATVVNDEDAAVIPVGSVEFFSIADGTTTRVSRGSAPVDATGTATVSTTALTAGGHTFVAVFTPTSPTAFVTSEGVRTANYGVVDTSAPTPYAPGGSALTTTGATASWDWSVYSGDWIKSVTGNATVTDETFTLTDGDVLADAGGAVISFEAELTVTAYTTYAVTLINPALHLKADGTGVWVAGPSGDRVVVGTFSGVDAKVGEDAVRTVAFDYADTTASGTWSATRTSAWPNGFTIEVPSAIRSFYYASGAGRDAEKPALPLTIDFVWPEVSATALQVTPSAPVALGSAVTLTATVSPAIAEGEVEFFDVSAVDGETSLGTADVEDGVATLTTNGLVAGGHTFRAEFTSSNGFTDSAAATTANYGVADTSQVEVCTPAALASESLTGVTAKWDWSAYSSGWEKYASGNVTLDGETFVLANGVATVSDDCVSIAFTGTLRTEAYQSFFPTHGQWVELVNPVLTIDAAGNGAWKAGVRTGAATLNTTTSAPTVIAEVRGATFPDFSENSVSASIDLAYAGTTAPGTWSAGRDSAWGNGFVLQVPSSIRSFYYASGAGGDPNKPAAPIQLDWSLAALSGTVNGQSSDIRVLQGQTVTFSAGPFRAGEVVSMVVNSDPVTLPNVTVGFDGIASQSWTVPTDFDPTAHSVTFSTGSGATARVLSVAFTVEPLGTEVVTPVEVCVARAISGGSMTWEFKQSFKSYIQGPIADGTFTGGSFVATGGSVNVNAGGIGRVNFQGSLSATGHDGDLNLRIQNPSVQITGPNSGVLYGTLTESGTGGSMAIANLAFSSVTATDSSLRVVGSSATLTGAAAAAFNGFYAAGTALDAVSFTASLGAEVACGAGTDPALASTGVDGASLLPLAGFGGLAALLGFALLRMRRRQHS